MLRRDAVGLLAGCRFLGQLTSLSLENNLLGWEGVRALASKPTLGGLTTLNLKQCDIGSKGLALLCESEALRNLRVLNVFNNGVDSLFFDSFRESPLAVGLD
jgi:hypothetical protein